MARMNQPDGRSAKVAARIGVAPSRWWNCPALLGAAAITGIMSAVAITYPSADLAVSAYFYVPGQGFCGAAEPAMLAVRSAGRIVPGLFIAALIGLAIFRLASRRPLAVISDRAMIFLGLCFSVAPGLIVNLLLKSHSGRPRPLATADFGGPLPFTPAWSWWGGCTSNCSFVSGEASTAMMLIALVFVAPRRYRLPIAIAVLIWTTVISMNRVAFGAHYLSDVVIACGLTLASVAIFKALVLDQPHRA